MFLCLICSSKGQCFAWHLPYDAERQMERCLCRPHQKCAYSYTQLHYQNGFIFFFFFLKALFTQSVAISVIFRVQLPQGVCVGNLFSSYVGIRREGLKSHFPPEYLFVFLWNSASNFTLLGQGSAHSGSASWDDCWWASPDELCLSSFPWWVPTLCLIAWTE